MKKFIFLILLSFCVFIQTNEVKSATFYVHDQTEFQTAMNNASSNGEDDIIYVENDMTITTTIDYVTNDADGGHDLSIIGNGHTLDGNNSTRILNINTDNDNSGDDSYCEILIDNLRLINGKADNSSGGALSIISDNATVTIRNSIFEDNTVTYNNGQGGGAWILIIVGSVIVDNNQFIKNSSDYDGGGIAIDTNDYDVNITVENNMFDSNRGEYGGGLCIESDGKVNILNNIFINNVSKDEGGGFYAYSDGGDIMVANNILYNNIAPDGDGGGAYIDPDYTTAFIYNNTFYGNEAGFDGGGLYMLQDFDGDTSYIFNNIFWQNFADEDGDDIYGVDDDNGNIIDIQNNDFSCNDFNGQSECIMLDDTFNYNHNANISADPLLKSPGSGDFHLSSNSPCIDKGISNVENLPDTDFEGDPRPIDGDGDSQALYDIGADEYKPSIQATATVPTLTEWGVILLFGLLSIISILKIKKLEI